MFIYRMKFSLLIGRAIPGKMSYLITFVTSDIIFCAVTLQVATLPTAVTDLIGAWTFSSKVTSFVTSVTQCVRWAVILAVSGKVARFATTVALYTRCISKAILCTIPLKVTFLTTLVASWIRSAEVFAVHIWTVPLYMTFLATIVAFIFLFGAIPWYVSSFSTPITWLVSKGSTTSCFCSTILCKMSEFAAFVALCPCCHHEGNVQTTTHRRKKLKE